MQSRGNRGLLFGARGSGPVGDSSTEGLESENQRGVDRLGGSAVAMKDIAIAIEADVADQNRLLDRVDKRFDSTADVVSRTLRAMQDLASDRTGSRMCTIIAGFFVTLLILYFMARRK